MPLSDVTLRYQASAADYPPIHVAAYTLSRCYLGIHVDTYIFLTSVPRYSVTMLWNGRSAWSFFVRSRSLRTHPPQPQRTARRRGIPLVVLLSLHARQPRSASLCWRFPCRALRSGDMSRCSFPMTQSTTHFVSIILRTVELQLDLDVIHLIGAPGKEMLGASETALLARDHQGFGILRHSLVREQTVPILEKDAMLLPGFWPLHRWL